MSRSWIIAAVVALAAIAWIGSGMVTNGAEPEDPVAEAPASAADDDRPESVRVREFEAEPMVNQIIVQGRTMADRKVTVRAEIDGIIEDVLVERGGRVAAGDIIAQLAVDDREARLEQARAELAAAQMEFDAASQLSERGYRAETDVARSRAVLDAARAAVNLAELKLDDLMIRAPFDGLVNERMVEIGDYVKSADPVAILIDLHPLRVAGQISERHLGEIEPGSTAEVRLIDGRMVEGTVVYVGAVAEEATRTFTIEIAIPNPEMRIIEGLTAELHLPLSEVMAHRMSPAFLHLADSGEIGVLSVDEDNIARFLPAQIAGGDDDAVWLTGLPETVTVITVGQGFVKPGQTVDPTWAEPLDTAATAETGR